MKVLSNVAVGALVLFLGSWSVADGASCTDTTCGCEEVGVTFCNYDDDVTGACELCEAFSSEAACYSDGLANAGAEDCAQKCFQCSSTGTGTCFSGTSTATLRLQDNGEPTQVPMAELIEGQYVLAEDEHRKPIFARIEKLWHSPAEEPYVEIVMQHKGNHDDKLARLQVTLHHTFTACSSQRHPAGNAALMAEEIKAGDCLHTELGRTTVKSSKRVAPKAGDVTYSIQLAGGVHTVAIGGVFTHAVGNKNVGNNAAKNSQFLRKKETHEQRSN